MKKIGIVITDGVGFRNFVLTDFITEVQQEFDEIIIFTSLTKTVFDPFQFTCKIVEIDVFEEKFINWFFRKTKEIAHLRLNEKGNVGIQNNLQINYNRTISIRGIATRFIYFWTSFFYSEKWILLYNYFQQLSFKQNVTTKRIIDIFECEKIDLLFFTHQRPPFIAPLIYAAERLKIKTSTFIFSWDNLASKNRMAGNFDYYLVWSDLMKSDLLKFYSTIEPQKIEIVGTPQFEPYLLKRYGYNRAELIERFSLNKNIPILFFTCNDSSSKNDPIYLDILARFIEENKLLSKVNLIVRTSPAEEPHRFYPLAEKYPFIIWNHPVWSVQKKNSLEQWAQRVPSVEDINDLKSILMHCDININVLSTITLDAMIFDKPVINPVFGNQTNALYDDQIFLNYKHIQHVVESKATAIAKDQTEFLDAINELLENPDIRIEQQRKLIQLEIGKPLLGTSKRIAGILLKWS